MQLTATDREAIAGFDITAFDRPSVAVDTVTLAYTDSELKILLVRRGRPPYTGGYALPGGFLKPGQETAPQAALREIAWNTGASLNESQIEQLGFYTDLSRDPRGNILSSAYIALLPEEVDVKGANDSIDAEWFTLTPAAHSITLVSDTISYTLHRNSTNELSPLAFDHHRIIFDAIDRLKSGLFYKNQALELLGELFTLPSVSDLYSLLTYGQIIKRKWKSNDLIKRLGDSITATEHTTEGVAHRPATLYMRNPLTRRPAL